MTTKSSRSTHAVCREVVAESPGLAEKEQVGMSSLAAREPTVSWVILRASYNCPILLDDEF